MSTAHNDINLLHSLRLRNKNYAAKRLLRPAEQLAFLNALKRALGENVYLISTGLGLDIYYLAKTKKTDFILSHLYLCHPMAAQEKNILILEERTGQDVLNFFDTAVESLAQHPQLFLSCCKKLIADFKTNGVDTKLSKMLFQTFTLQLNRLSNANRLPHALKIGQLQARDYSILQGFIDRSKRLMRDFKAQKNDN